MATTKLTITIPDDLAERLKPWRERMNISRICSEAIAKEVAILANLPQEVRELTDLIAKLRVEKAESQQRDYQTGFENGVNYGKRAAYKELVAWGNELPEGGTLLAGKDYLPEWAEDHLNDMLEEGWVLDWEWYVRGWRAGMASIWRLIEDKI